MPAKSTALHNLTGSQVTDESIYRDRRRILKSLGYVGASSFLAPNVQAGIGEFFSKDKATPFDYRNLSFQKDDNNAELTLTSEAKVTSHNNFYEFGTDKSDPLENAQGFKVNPWQLRIDGLVENPITLDYDDLFKRFALEERIYRFRCVEAWSMVIPWIGFELNKLIALAKPLSSAKYVAFETLFDPDQMPGQKSRFVGGGVQYPYVEGLRLDEAANPLTLMAVGLYGKNLPPQNGAPIRLVVPWKYGFKSIKSIVKISLTDKVPPTTWNILASHEYGFYANVNPNVDHPRWSQGSERVITQGGLFSQKRAKTLMFNGYGEQVADLYKGMDLKRYY